MSDSKKLTEADCAYLAALIDAYGSVQIRPEGRNGITYRTILLVFTRVPQAMADWLALTFELSGSVKLSGGARITSVSKRAAELCVHAYPYLLRMKKHAQLLTRFAQSIGQKGAAVTKDQEQIRRTVESDLEKLQIHSRAKRS